MACMPRMQGGWRTYRAAVNIGLRPAEGSEPNLHVGALLDFGGEIYERVCANLCGQITRGTIFDSLDALRHAD